MWKPGIEVVKNKIDKFAPKMFCRQLNLVLLLLLLLFTLSSQQSEVKLKKITPENVFQHTLKVSLSQRETTRTVNGGVVVNVDLDLLSSEKEDEEEGDDAMRLIIEGEKDVCIVVNGGFEVCDILSLSSSQSPQSSQSSQKSSQPSQYPPPSSSSSSKPSMILVKLPDNRRITVNLTTTTSIESGNLFITARIRDKFTSAIMTSSRPTLMSLSDAKNPTNEKITFVLTLTLNDLERATLLLATLSKFLPNLNDNQNCHNESINTCDGGENGDVNENFVEELILIVPDNEFVFFSSTLPQFLLNTNTRIRIIPEASLFPLGTFDGAWDKYSLQMSLKLLVANVVNTEYYLTLDADILVHEHLSYSSFIRDGRAFFDLESRAVHKDWWLGSKSVLKLDYYSDSDDDGDGDDDNTILDSDDPKNGFGVTPAVMSTAGALFTLARLDEVSMAGKQFDWIADWSESWWSEYTLYRTVLDYTKTFDKLYDNERILFASENGASLSCGNIWFAGDVWVPKCVFEKTEGQTCDKNANCVFSVIQSTSGASPRLIAQNIAKYL